MNSEKEDKALTAIMILSVLGLIDSLYLAYLHHVIAEHCLPKLVCELHRKSMEEFETYSESEKSLISLIG